MSVSALFFICLLIGLGVFPGRTEAGFLGNIFKFFGGSSQAAAVEEASSAGLSLPLLGSKHPAPMPPANGSVEDDIFLQVTQENALVSTRNPLGTLPRQESDQIVVYRVEAGDTPGAIAERFGISLNTLLWANNLRSAGAIQIGDELVILPVTGVQYEIKKGDTIDGIAKKLKADVADIISFNGLAIGEPLVAGATLIIPDGELIPAASSPGPAAQTLSRFAGLPDLKGFFMRPILGGRKSRGMHGFNGVDLADSCGMPVYASAEGAVIITRASGWNGGYGKYIVVSHPNGAQTLYAHLSAIGIGAGQRVFQGTQIGLIGSSGNSTGCHVHFEIRGAKNPF